MGTEVCRNFEVCQDFIINGDTGEIMAEWNYEKMNWVVDELAAEHYKTGTILALCIWACGKVPESLMVY